MVGSYLDEPLDGNPEFRVSVSFRYLFPQFLPLLSISQTASHFDGIEAITFINLSISNQSGLKGCLAD